ncbi:methyltransferase-domain-containing protein [Paraphoma chrysanthemicola]|nr:methyltransferase-domain-containing protein [Paraphoma chrysanthemicola]
MFSVPGWNVSAPVATQVEKPKPKDPNKLGKKALKRKEKQEQQANAENIGELWDKVVDNKDAKPQTVPATIQNGVEETGDASQEKRGKKRKRGKSNKDKSQTEDAARKDGEPSVTVDKTAGSPATDTISAEKPAATDKDESKRDKKKRKKDQKAQKAQDTAPVEPIQPMLPTSLIPEPAGLTPLQKSMRSKLASARFRHLNESLYTKPSEESLSLFKDDPTMFEDYHRGFAQQVEVWPENPVDGYVNSILARGKLNLRDPWKDKQRKEKRGQKVIEPEPVVSEGTGVRATGDSKPLPRHPNYHATIADLGCGTASLAYRLKPHTNGLKLTIHSFDLSKPTGPSAPLVTVADISALPLPPGSVDVAIFCLALMGTNWLDFIDEAYRILRWKGELWVSEIKSRFGRVERKKGGVPINSIGSLKKALPEKKAKGKKKDKPEEEGIADSADESELAQRVDGAQAPEGTDVSAFVEVLKRRGFVLDALPERQNEAIDLSNKMFVNMQFVKAAQPTKGKNAKKQEGDGKGARDERGMKFGMKGKKFGIVTEEQGVSEEVEKKVLKPCLYKIR